MANERIGSCPISSYKYYYCYKNTESYKTDFFPTEIPNRPLSRGPNTHLPRPSSRGPVPVSIATQPFDMIIHRREHEGFGFVIISSVKNTGEWTQLPSSECPSYILFLFKFQFLFLSNLSFIQVFKINFQKSFFKQLFIIHVNSFGL